MRMANVLFTLLAVGLIPFSALAKPDKVEICHFPPDNPTNVQQITVAAPALQSHLNHGDIPVSELPPNAPTCEAFVEQGPTDHTVVVLATLIMGWGGLMLYRRYRRYSGIQA